MLYRNEFLALLFESTRTSDHRLCSPPVVKQDLRHIRKFPAMLQSGQPEIPIFQYPNRHCGIISPVLLPNRTPIDGAGRNVIPLQQSIPIKRADMPAARTRAEVFGIAVNDANLRIRGQDSNSMVDPAATQPDR